jgi:hypothetical protein
MKLKNQLLETLLIILGTLLIGWSVILITYYYCK